MLYRPWHPWDRYRVYKLSRSLGPKITFSGLNSGFNRMFQEPFEVSHVFTMTYVVFRICV